MLSLRLVAIATGTIVLGMVSTCAAQSSAHLRGLEGVTHLITSPTDAQSQISTEPAVIETANQSEAQVEAEKSETLELSKNSSESAAKASDDGIDDSAKAEEEEDSEERRLGKKHKKHGWGYGNNYYNTAPIVNKKTPRPQKKSYVVVRQPSKKGYHWRRLEGVTEAEDEVDNDSDTAGDEAADDSEKAEDEAAEDSENDGEEEDSKERRLGKKHKRRGSGYGYGYYNAAPIVNKKSPPPPKKSYVVARQPSKKGYHWRRLEGSEYTVDVEEEKDEADASAEEDETEVLNADETYERRLKTRVYAPPPKKTIVRTYRVVSKSSPPRPAKKAPRPHKKAAPVKRPVTYVTKSQAPQKKNYVPVSHQKKSTLTYTPVTTKKGY